ncbi:Laccase-like multicopper oxidase 1 [Cladobotryum mycophilum]|uniref:Laccase-like multicopper oxidase 1 n=1 Tax=Cladobotryum mycophilum TaxID=491253 RepID=A0ABR0T3C8_9HYPO
MAWYRAWVCFCILLSPAIALETKVHDDSFTPNEVLRVTRKDISVGGINRYTTLVNNSLPGPTLRIPEDKVVWLRVYNDMTDANLTMHWHGLTQAAYPFSDGSPMASQWPIPPSHYFDYELRTDKGTAGTYFYHSHIDFQTSTASGPLIVEDSDPVPYKTDGERIIHIQEMWNKTDDDILAGLEATPLRWSGETNGFLLNGNTISNYGIVDKSSAKLTVIDVDPGKTYRFRFIAATALSYASFAFEEHTDLEVIEADGGYTKPLATELLQMGSGQRFSTLFKTKSCDDLKKLGRLDYYMQIETRDRPTVVTNYAVVRYSNTCKLEGSDLHVPTTSYPKTAPIKLPPTINGFLDYKLEPFYPNNFPSASEVTRRVHLNAQQVMNKWLTWRNNNISWTEDSNDPLPHVTPYSPYLVSMYKNETRYLPNYEAAVANGGLDPATFTYPAKIGEVIEIVLQHFGSITLDGSPGGSLDTHPWHAHGKHYYDIGGGEGAYDPDLAEERLKGTNPVQRDTTMLYRYNATTKPDQVHGWRAWRLRIDDPGVWMIHCHTLQHMIFGMQTVWVFGDRDDIMKVGAPAVSGYLEYGGNVNGNATHAPEVLHFSELDDAGS